MPIDITTAEELLFLKGRVLLLAFAEWAPPSVSMLARLEQIEGLQTATLDIETHPEVAKLLDIRAVPTLIVLVDGEYKAFKVGLISAVQAYAWAVHA